MTLDGKAIDYPRGEPLTPDECDALLARWRRERSPWEWQAFLDAGGYVALHPYVLETVELVASVDPLGSPWRTTFHRRHLLTWRGVLEVRPDTALRHDEIRVRREESLTR